jgi:hypothetical protein
MVQDRAWIPTSGSGLVAPLANIIVNLAVL